jgi:ribonuclease VapC
MNPNVRKFSEAIEEAESRSLSTASFVECSMIVEARYGPDGVRDFDLLIAKAQISLVPVDEEHADLARRAFRKYGKGRHPAGLNFGDCFSYALAKALEEPLLFKGDDFSQTDVECHPASRGE